MCLIYYGMFAAVRKQLEGAVIGVRKWFDNPTSSILHKDFKENVLVPMEMVYNMLRCESCNLVGTYVHIFHQI